LHRIFRHWVSFLLKFYPLLIAGVCIWVAFSVPRMVNLLQNISTDPVDLLPRSYASVQSLLKVRDNVESRTRFAVVLESEHPETMKKVLEALKPKLAQNPLIGKVEDKKVGYQFFDKHKLLYLDLEDLKTIRDRIDRKIQRSKLGPLFVDLEGGEDNKELDFKDLEEKYKIRYRDGAQSEFYESPDGKLLALFVESKAPGLGLSDQTRFQESVQKDIETFDFKAFDSGMKVYFAGATKVIEYRALVRDLKIAGLISGILIFLPLLIRFRKPHIVLLIFLPMALGLPVSFALASLWVSKLNVTTSFLFAILGGLGIETGIHLFSRYHSKRGEGYSIRDALMDLYLFLGPAVLTAVASLAVTFLLLLFSDFRGFSEFGFISGIGLWVIFFFYFTFFPALLIASEKLRILKIEAAAERKEWSPSFHLRPGFVRWGLLFCLLFTAGSVAATPFVRFEYNSKKIRSDDPATRVAKEKQREASGKRVNSPAVTLVMNEEEAKDLETALEERRKANPLTTIDTTRSYYSLVPNWQKEKMKVIDEMKELLADDTIKLVKEEKKKDLDKFKQALNETTPVEWKDVPEDVLEVFRGKRDRPGVLFFVNALPELELDDGRNAIAFADEVSEVNTPAGVFHPSSDAVVYGQVLKTMFRDSKKVLVISFLSVFGFVFLNFRNFKKACLVMVPIVAGVFWVMGLLWLGGVSLNLYNMVMIPSIMGMSIDNSIHVYHSYEELGKGSLEKVLASAGLSSLLASLTNAAGFLGLLFCHHGGLRSMGIVATLGLLTCLISTLVFLPMILQFWEWRKEKSALESSVLDPTP